MAQDRQQVSRRDRYAVLLVLLVVFLAIQSSDFHGTSMALATGGLRAALGVAVVLVVFERARSRLAMAGVLAATTIAGLAWLQAGPAVGPALRAGFHALMAAFLLAALVAILRRLLRDRSSGGANVLGAICGYLLAGDALAQINALVHALDPGAYAISQEVSVQTPSLQGSNAVFLYYSYSQLLTLGYADVTPLRAPATTLSLFAALFGIFYTAIVVAQFVVMKRDPDVLAGDKPEENP